MNILYIITSWDFGGAEMQVALLAKKMLQLGHKVKIVSMIKPNKAFCQKYPYLKNYVIHLNMTRGIPNPLAIYKLIKIIKKFKPDVIHAHMIHAIILSRITKLFYKPTKIISTAHSINEGGKLRNLMYRYTDFLSDLNTNVSKKGVNEYIEKGLFSKNKSLFVPNGIVLSKEKNYILENTSNLALKKMFDFKENDIILLAVGRLTEAKDYDNLINAINFLDNKNLKLLIAGTGHLKNKIQNKINKFRLQNNIKLLGLRNDIIFLMKNADFFVMSSAWEGLPIVLLEAASVGLPAVVTDVGGNKEIIENDKNGYVVPPNNYKSLANKIDVIINKDRRERKKFGEFSIKKIHNEYEIDVVVKKWLEIYEKA